LRPQQLLRPVRSQRDNGKPAVTFIIGGKQPASRSTKEHIQSSRKTDLPATFNIIPCFIILSSNDTIVRRDVGLVHESYRGEPLRDRLSGETESVLLFVKSPEKGKVKSRLASATGDETALHIYRSFVLDIVDMLKNRARPPTICFYPHDAEETVVNWLGRNFSYLPQRGEDLGERMENAFADSFSGGAAKVVLIGSDIPDLTTAVIDESFSCLEQDDAVIGPASDGGYYLIGFRKNSFLHDIFRGIFWGAGSVFRETMRIFAGSGLHVHVLPEWNDVDTLDDLRSLFARNTDTGFRESRSMSLCRNIFADKKNFPGKD